MTSTRPRRAAGLLAAVLALTAAPPATAAPTGTAPVEPPGTTVVLADAAWSWFEDARATFGAGGSTLYVSGVASAQSTAVLPGSVLLTELSLPSGARRQVALGRSETDDHNSAAILETETSEIVTAWTGHLRSNRIYTQRRRTDGSWLLLPPIEVTGKVTYSNLFRSPTGTDSPDLLYDFYRGERSDPSVLASADVGRTWASLGRLLQDPADGEFGRPYVVYTSLGDGRIDLIATEAHPRDFQTSIYHGYIEDGLLHRSDGTVLTPIGTPVPVTDLTQVWTQPPGGTERAWTSDIVIDPVTHEPVVTFSVRHSATDHRYWHARYTGGGWQAQEVAYAGRALFDREEDYTGLITLDPRDPDRVVISTDVDPVLGTPLLSASDGEVHWELFEGERDPGGTFSWVPLTSHSTADNLRPVFATHPGGASALLWMRGDYPSFTTYDTDIVGVVRPPAGAPVAAGAMQTVTPLQVLADPPAHPVAAVPISGDFDSHGADDVYLYRAGSAGEQLLLGDEQGRPTPVAARIVGGTYQPIPGDFDGDGDTDIYWYAPGSSAESLWLGAPNGRFTNAPTRTVGGTYRPIPGDFDGDGDTDIYWYAPGATAESLWLGSAAATFANAPTRQVSGTYTPIPGDFDADQDTDIYWYAPGATAESLWLAGPAASFTNAPTRSMATAYTPIPGDYDGDGDTDIHWYAPGATAESLWLAGPAASFADAPTRNVSGTYRPIAGDLDGDGDTDLHWYAPGSAADHVWWWEPGATSTSQKALLNL